MQKITNDIESYRNTLKDANEKVIQKLMNSNEKYFYITLPYAYMLNIEDTFIEKYGFFVKNKPQWFITKEDYNIYEINVIIFNKIEELINS